MSTQNLQDSTFLNQIINAYRLRAQVIGVTPTIATVSPGDNIQQAAFWAALQTAIAAIINGYVNPADPFATPLSQSNPPKRLSLTSILASLGYSTTSSWRRCRPREINTTTDTHDTIGNTCAVGHKAWLLAGTGAGHIHKYDGSVWTRTLPSEGPVDVLDSETPAPFHVAPGVIQQGDYLRITDPYLHRQIIEVLGKLTTTNTPTSANAPAGAISLDVQLATSAPSSYSRDDKWAKASNAYESNWGTVGIIDDLHYSGPIVDNWATQTNGGGGGLGIGGQKSITTYRNMESGSLDGLSLQDAIAGLSANSQWRLIRVSAPPITRSATWYNRSRSIAPDFPGSTTVIFDDFGDPVVQDTLHAWATTSTTNAATIAVTWPNISTKPPFTEPSVTDAFINIRGYVVDFATVVEAWDFPALPVL